MVRRRRHLAPETPFTSSGRAALTTAAAVLAPFPLRHRRAPGSHAVPACRPQTQRGVGGLCLGTGEPAGSGAPAPGDRALSAV